jgi:hypothetical protein
MTTYMKMKLNPYWITGFIDGEGCFNLDVHVKQDMKWGIQIQPEFTVVQNELDIEVLYALKDFFNCGSVTVNRKDKNGIRYHYRVKSVRHRTDHILPFFEKYPLHTKKANEFQIFKQICLHMSQNFHRESLSNFLKLVDLGENLRVRSRPKKISLKRTKVDIILSELRNATL